MMGIHGERLCQLDIFLSLKNGLIGDGLNRMIIHYYGFFKVSYVLIIMQLQHSLKTSTKTPTQSITDYMQPLKTLVDEHGILGKKMGIEDVTHAILNGLEYLITSPTTLILCHSTLLTMVMMNLSSEIVRLLLLLMLVPKIFILTIFSFKLTNAFCVPSYYRNINSISRLCIDNNILIKFS